jgi:hypothetical protein
MGAQTPTFAIPYPVGTDRVMDGDNAMQALAERVDLMPKQVTDPVNFHGTSAGLGAAAAIITASFTGVVAGLYAIVYTGTFTCPASGSGTVSLAIDGVTVLSRPWNNDGGASDTAVVLTVFRWLAAGTRTVVVTANNAGTAGAGARTQDVLLSRIVT